MIFGALSLASGIAKYALPGKSLVSSLAPANVKDKERAQRAQASLAQALNGDLNAAQEIFTLKGGSATAYGKAQYQAAWDQIVAKMPGLAAQVEGRTGEQPINVQGYTPSTADKLRAELERLKDGVRAQAAEAAGRVLSGTTAGVQESIDPAGNYFTVPTERRQLYMIGAAVIAALVILWLVLRK